jgi:hypothetical protein
MWGNILAVRIPKALSDDIKASDAKRAEIKVENAVPSGEQGSGFASRIFRTLIDPTAGRFGRCRAMSPSLFIVGAQ